MSHMLFLLLIVYDLVPAALGLEKVLHVPGEYLTFQAAIDAAENGDTVKLAPGVYRGPGNRDLLLVEKSIISIGEAGPESTIIDCEGQGRGLEVRGMGANGAVISGLTIQNGADVSGGGILCIYASPRLEHLILQENQAFLGGGITVIGASPRMKNCVLTHNLATFHGGGFYVDGSGDEAGNPGAWPVFEDVLIAYNLSRNIGGGGYSQNASIMVLNRCRFQGNAAASGFGSGFFSHEEDSFVTIQECEFRDNGGFAIECDASSPAIDGCAFTWNGGMHGGVLSLSKDSRPRVTNCVLAGNF